MNNKDEIIKKLQIKNGKLQIQIERLKLDKEEYYLDYLNLQQKIDKAIEEIKTILEMAKDYEMVNLVDRLENILDILRGENNDIK